MRKQRVGKVLGIVIIICFALTFASSIVLVLFAKQTFRYETSINGIDCSFMSVETAGKKLEQEMNKAEITLLFADNKEYTCLGAFFEIELSNTEKLKELLDEQIENKENKEYQQINLYSINENKVKEYLSSLSVFKESNIRKPENAYLELDSNNHLYIEPEVYGNEINYEEACSFMIEALKKGERTIDFREITNIVPEICSTDEDLISQMNYINSIVSTTINYKIDESNTYTLDVSIMKEWVYQDEEGNYGIDLETNIPIFVDSLNEKAKYLLTSTNFNATDLGTIPIAFGRKTYANIDKEAETARIKEQLGSSKEIDLEPIYAALPDYTNLDTYLELDLTRQNVWMYVDGKCIVNTPCVTGSVAGGYSTPVGIYYLTYKTTDTYLEGYNSDGSRYKSHVNFWMPFNGDIGLHDAVWRSNFGGKIYMANGSHGCVNLPYNAAKIIYQNINTSIPIILYAS